MSSIKIIKTHNKFALFASDKAEIAKIKSEVLLAFFGAKFVERLAAISNQDYDIKNIETVHIEI